MDVANHRSFEGLRGTVLVQRPAPGVAILVIDGEGVVELGDAPLRCVEDELAVGRKLDLFVDARDSKASSVMLALPWAAWIERHKDAIARVSILIGAPFVHIHARCVHRLSTLQGLLHVYTRPGAFEEDVLMAIADADA